LHFTPLYTRLSQPDAQPTFTFIIPKKARLIESDKPSYQILKWLRGGGFNHVIKVLRNGQVQGFLVHKTP
jgi:hypothetical protein